jgi:hypothetical protein
MGHRKAVGRDIDWCCMADKEEEEEDYTARKKYSGTLSKLLAENYTLSVVRMH